MSDAHKKSARILIKKGLLEKPDALKLIKLADKLEEKRGAKVSLKKLAEKKGLLKAEPEQEKVKKSRPKKNNAKQSSRPEDSAANLENSIPDEDLFQPDAHSESVSATLTVEDTITREIKGVSCPECGAEAGEEKSCPVCSADLSRIGHQTCPACGLHSPKKSRHCPSCGTDIATGSAGPTTPRCGECGRGVLPGDAICRRCGAPRDTLKTSGFSDFLPLFFLVAILAAFSGLFAMKGGSIQSDAPDQRIYQASIFDVETLDIEGYDPANSDIFTDRAVKAAISSAKEGSWEEAIANLPREPEKWSRATVLMLIRALSESGQKKKALSIAFAIQDEDPLARKLVAEIGLKEAKQLLEEGQKPSTLLIDPAVDLWPDNIEVRLLAGLIYYQAGLTLPAKLHLNHALELNPEQPEVLFLLYLIHKEADKTNAEKYLNQLKQYNELPEYMNNRINP